MKVPTGYFVHRLSETGLLKGEHACQSGKIAKSSNLRVCASYPKVSAKICESVSKVARRYRGGVY